ncbi:peptidyl-prolyl cis-trans isomerase B (cyclophilin B) [Streptomyces sp. 2224.1]|uniref:peptidylprolyl isomerase n=1 Tax=unclassified Streptomyces TaxID=2593676 RepID=UPI0008859E5F|nr:MULTISPECIES: peptidylprolyl isomerase [unclassified Streptomyces]PBC81311.1 peptidyl-prolyl cis-trans isomerase B (cyclophilin B) [Streptomyces sp. 2321.6]SDR55623.1 peptidyl-prolyl cis-trans isomerase B (cyclophilin B) [Streptomyces sp. KS_16]SEC09785.1 peptidyl-prolyl cis-trans isomerase B (cyclophilin B) [Streptomyces sp. 2133.1]SED20138.1 peptidyl-prolyl cis-trans isomerase B (cyclophilin B) [Streptomyces sp. 2224.1]SEF08815.1 peptidyl-prolyl cis-trans isomerase B (cyclophilin B) [Stre
MVSKDQRRRQLAREKYERQQQRRSAAQRKAKRRNVIIASVAAVALAAGAAVYASAGLAGGSDQEDRAAAPTPSKAPDPCNRPAKGSPSKKTWPKEPAMSLDTSASYSAKLATTCGTIGIKLDAGKAPHTVNSFAFLAGQGYFDHSKCHRLVDEGIFVLQCGDPKGTGQGTPGYTIPDENLKDPRLKGGVYPAGTVAMANRYDGASEKTRNSGGSQFFLVYQDSKLPPNYTPFGTITGGMDVLRKIAKAGATTDPQTHNSAPNATVVIDKASVQKS